MITLHNYYKKYNNHKLDSKQQESPRELETELS